MLYDPLSGEFGITRFDGFAAALFDAADIDSTSGDKVLEAAGCLGTNLNPEIIGPAKPVKRYEHLTGWESGYFMSEATAFAKATGSSRGMPSTSSAWL